MCDNDWRVIFSSRLPSRVSIDQINEMLATSMVLNMKHGVRAILVLYRDTFVQLMEGEKREIIETLNRIRRDGRHDFVRVLCNEQCAECLITQRWFMTFIDLNLQQIEQETKDAISNAMEMDVDVAKIKQMFLRLQVIHES